MNTSSSSSNNLESQRQEESSFKLKSRLSSSIENKLISPHYHQHQISRSTSLGSNAGTIPLSSPISFMPHNKNMCVVATGGGPSFGVDINVDDHDPLGDPSSFVPPPPAVTVVLEGRSICQRISLHKHASYLSLAKALRQMFVLSDDIHAAADGGGGDDDLNLSNAIPGHLIAYEDMENDLLLAGDLSWRDFVKVAKRIRILPVKKNLRKGRAAGGIN